MGLVSYKRGQTGIILRLFIADATSTTGGGLAGITNATSGLKIYAIADNEAAAAVYSTTNLETITGTLGTYQAPTSGKARIKLVEDTDAPGLVEIHLENTRYAVTSAKSLIVKVSGVTNMVVTVAIIPLTDIDPYDSVRAGMTALPNAAAGAAHGLVLGSAAYELNITSAGKVQVPDTQSINVATIGGATAYAADTEVNFGKYNGNANTFADVDINGQGHISRISGVTQRATDIGTIAYWLSKLVATVDIHPISATSNTVVVAGASGVKLTEGTFIVCLLGSERVNRTIKTITYDVGTTYYTITVDAPWGLTPTGADATPTTGNTLNFYSLPTAPSAADNGAAAWTDETGAAVATAIDEIRNGGSDVWTSGSGSTITFATQQAMLTEGVPVIIHRDSPAGVWYTFVTGWFGNAIVGYTYTFADDMGLEAGQSGTYLVSAAVGNMVGSSAPTAAQNATAAAAAILRTPEDKLINTDGKVTTSNPAVSSPVNITTETTEISSC